MAWSGTSSHLALVERQSEFARRAEVYRELDALLRSRTRFFAAASLTNAVLAHLFRVAPGRSLQDSYRLLSEAGAMLERANLTWAQELLDSAPVDTPPERFFVHREQRLLQTFVVAAGAATGCVRRTALMDLNQLLNGRHWTLFLSPCAGHTRRFVNILRKVRTGLGTRFEFDRESHRIELGLAIVRDVHERAGSPTFPPGPPERE